MRKLLDYGFANYETVKIAEKGEAIKKINIEKGDVENIQAVTSEDIGITVKKGTSSQVRTKSIINENLPSKIKQGEKVGSIMIYEGKKLAAEYDLVSDRDVKPADIITIYIRMMKNLI